MMPRPMLGCFQQIGQAGKTGFPGDAFRDVIKIDFADRGDNYFAWVTLEMTSGHDMRVFPEPDWSGDFTDFYPVALKFGKLHGFCFIGNWVVKSTWLKSIPEPPEKSFSLQFRGVAMPGKGHIIGKDRYFVFIFSCWGKHHANPN